MNKSKYYKNLFLIGGLWNLGASVPCWLGGIFMPDFVFGILGMAVPAVMFPHHVMYGLIISFGIGYIIVSRDITKNHAILVVGIIAKVIFLIACVITVALKEANVLLVLMGIVEIIFFCLFLEFLLSVKKYYLKDNMNVSRMGRILDTLT
jgi:hypothetical protein